MAITIKDRSKTWRFILNSNKGEYELLFNPLEWEATEYGMVREEFGMSFTFSGDYTYTKDGYDYIKSGLDVYGILWECTLTIKRYNNHSQVYDIALESKKLDFSRIVEENALIIEETLVGNSISVPLVDNRFLNAITSRQGDDIPYNRLETISGETIVPFDHEYETVTVLGQETKSVGTGTGDDLGYNITNNGWVGAINMESNSVSVQSTSFSTFEFWATGQIVPTNDLLYFTTAKSYVEYKFDVNFRLFSNPSSMATSYIYKTKKISENGWELSDELYKAEYNAPAGDFNILFEGNIILQAGEGLLLIFRTSEGFPNSGFEIYNTSSIMFNAIEKALPMDIQHISLKQLHIRVIEAITDQHDNFVGSIFEEGGKWEHVFASNGLLYRRYPASESNFAVTFPDLTKDLRHILGVGYGTIFEDGKQKVICEDISFFWKDNVTAIIEHIELHSFVRELAIDLHISNIIVGTKKREYEQIGGLSSWSTFCNYSTILSILDNQFDLQSELHVDGNWHEFTRRIAYVKPEDGVNEDNISTTDSKYDKDLCLMEAVHDGSNWKQRGEEDFSAVTGLGIVTTPINLNLTPARSIYRWGEKINIGLRLYADKKIQFNDSEVATELTTTRTDDGILIKENKAIIPTDLPSPFLTGNVIRCRADISLEFLAYIAEHPYERVQIPNPIDGGVVQGWIKQATTNPIGDTLTNLEIYEAIDILGTESAILWNNGMAVNWNTDNNIIWNNNR